MGIRDKCSVNVNNLLFSFCAEAGHLEDFAEEVFYKVSTSTYLFAMSDEDVRAGETIEVGYRVVNGNTSWQQHGQMQQTLAHR